jgi:mRNA interferase MazF
MKKARPCVVLSPNELNRHFSTVIVAPLTSAQLDYPSRVPCQFEGKQGQIALDHLRSVDKKRLRRNRGAISNEEQKAVLEGLAELFAE